MHTDKLISRIKAVLDGDSGHFEVQTLAIEYADLMMHVRDRLEQCVSLIRAGNDFAALQVAESAPPLLDTAAQLSFLESLQWIELCRERNLPYPSRLDQGHVDLVSGLYGRQISESHPLYRDYRQAIRERDDLRALEVLASILRVNPDDHNAQAELVRLGEKTRETQLQKLAALLAEGNDPAAFALTESLERASLPGLALSPVFQHARARRETHGREQARREVLATLAVVEPMRDTDDWAAAVPLLARCRSLAQEHRLELTTASQARMRELEEWAGEHQRAHAEALARQEALRQVGNALVAATASPEPRHGAPRAVLKRFAVELRAMLAAAAGFERELDPDLLVAARQLRLRIERRIQRRDVVLASGIAALLAVCVTAGMLAYGYHASTARRDEAVARMHELLGQGELFPAEKFLQSVGERWRGNDDFEQAWEELAGWVADNRTRLDSCMVRAGELQNLSPGTATPEVLRDGWMELRRLETEIAGLPADTRRETTGAFSGAVTRLQVIQSRLEAEEAPGFARRLDALEKTFLDALDEPELKARSAALAALQAVWKKLDEDGELLEVVLDAELVSRWRMLSERIGADTAFWENAVRTENLFAGTVSLDTYLTLLRAEAGEGNAAARHVAGHAEVFKHPVDTLVTPLARPLWRLAEALPAGGTSFLPTDTRPGESAEAGRLAPSETLQKLWRYHYRPLPETEEARPGVVYTIGQVRATRFPIGDGFELRQEAEVLQEDGSPVRKVYNMRQFGRLEARGETLTDGRPAPEAGFLQQFSRFYDRASGRIQEPLLITLDRVRNTYDISPLFKAYLMQEILKITATRPAEWGVLFSPRVQADAATLRLMTQGSITFNDWLNPVRWADRMPQLERHFAPPQLSYMDEAQAYLRVFQALAKPGFVFVGYINSDGRFQPVTRHLLSGQLAVLTRSGQLVMRPAGQFVEIGAGAEGAARALKVPSLAAPYSPVLMLGRTPEEAARLTEFPETATPPASGWSTLVFLPEYSASAASGPGAGGAVFP